MRRILFVLALALVPFGARADTVFVDDGGGPGADFTDVQPAIDAASDGDVIIVQPGNYGCITVTKSLTILGPGDNGTILPDARIGALSSCSENTVRDLPADGLVNLANLAFERPLRASACAGTVYVAECTGLERVTDCLDFRAFETRGVGVEITSSHAELAACTIFGLTGPSVVCCCGGGDGGVALYVTSSDVHLAHTTVIGGTGGSVSCDIFEAGDGGNAIQVVDSAVRISGTDGLVRGGEPGAGLGSFGGDGIVIFSGLVRLSGASVVGGSIGGQPVVNQGGTLEQPSVIDPSLSSSGPPLAGTTVTLTLEGPPGAFAALLIGRNPILVSISPWIGDLLVPREGFIHLGAIPASGTVDTAFPIPAFSPPGSFYMVQGIIGLAGGDRRLSNSAPVIAR